MNQSKINRTIVPPLMSNKTFLGLSPAVRIEKGDGGPGELVVWGDEKSSPGERPPANPVHNSPHKTAKELHVSKGVDVSAN